jgi:tetratricopeptide (TPR) repeat protein
MTVDPEAPARSSPAPPPAASRGPSQQKWLLGALFLVAALGAIGALAWPGVADLWRKQVQKDWYGRARGYAAEGDTAEAVRAFQRAEAAGLATPEFYDRWGRIEMYSMQGIRAETHLDRALEIDPGYGPARANLAQLYFRRGWSEQAAQQYVLAAAALPDSAAPLLAIAGALYEGTGKRDRAAEMYRKALAARRGYLPALEGLLRLGKPLPGR